MKKITNPTENEISVSIFGHKYTLAPGASMTIRSEDAEYWKNQLHQFIVIEEESALVESETPTVEVEVQSVGTLSEDTVLVEAGVEEVEVVEEKPKAKKKK